MENSIAIAAALETAPLPSYVFRAVDAELVLVAANAAARAQSPMIGTLIGHPMAHLYRDQPELIEDVRRAMHERTTVVREMSVRRHDRLEANQRLRLVFSFVEPDLLTIYSQDLAEPSALAAALRESDERYRSLVASLPDAFLMRDRNGVVLSANQAAADMLGARDVAELIGRSDLLPKGTSLESLDGQNVPPHQRLTQLALATGTPARGIFRLTDADGSVRWLRSSAAPIRGPGGEIVGSTSITADETDRVRAEREVLASAEKLHMALAAARMGTFAWEPALDRGEWSHSSTTRFALPHLPDVDPGFGGFLRRIHPDDRERAARINEELVASADGTTFEHELRVVGEDGVTRWARMSGRVEAPDGAPRILGTIMDVTEQHRLEEELAQAQRLESIGRLAGGLAHDFNNMLGAMLSSLELLERHVEPSGREDHQTIRHAAERARELTSQLLAFARKRPIQRTTFDLAALVRTVDPLLRRLVGPTCDVRIDARDEVWVRGDAAQLEQCLLNLVANARDAGGPVDVSLRTVQDEGGPARAVLEVVDRGPGMDDATRARAFEPFFTTKSAGTGLGLASTYGVVRQHEGVIEIESRPGAGTLIRVVLPAVDAAQAPRAVPTTHVAHALSGAILVVDDEALVRRAAQRVLTALGFDAFTASNLEEAAAIVREQPLVAVVSDLAMPTLSGPDLVAELRKIRPALPVLFVSGYSDIELTPAIPHTAFLAKPYTRDALARQLHELIGARNASAV